MKKLEIQSRPRRLLVFEARPLTVMLCALFCAVFAVVAAAQQRAPKPYASWNDFVTVDGQPQPVPVQWVMTPEGKFAHSIKIPNPLPKDSGYRKGMTSQEYFEHLCRTEAGEFIYKTVENVEGFYFMRPPRRPTDDDLKDRYKLEAPDIERTFQLMRPSPEDRAKTFVNPPWGSYSFVEEPNPNGMKSGLYVRVFGYKQEVSPMQSTVVNELRSQYGLIWRGVRRNNDRELAIAGSEWLVIDLRTQEVLAIQRNYARTGFNRNTLHGIWWLNALSCPTLHPRDSLSNRFYRFLSKSLRPVSGIGK